MIQFNTEESSHTLWTWNADASWWRQLGSDRIIKQKEHKNDLKMIDENSSFSVFTMYEEARIILRISMSYSRPDENSRDKQHMKYFQWNQRKDSQGRDFWTPAKYLNEVIVFKKN